MLCRLKVRNSVRRLLHRTLVAAFAAWTAFAASRHNLRVSEQQVGRLPRQRMLGDCWQLWWQQYTGRRRLRAATGRIMHGTAARVLQQWRVGQAAACTHAASATACLSHAVPLLISHLQRLLRGMMLMILGACSFTHCISASGCVSVVAAAVHHEGCTVKWWPCTACSLSARRLTYIHALQAAAVARGQQRTKAARCLALMRNRALGQAFRSWAAYAAHVKVGPQQADPHMCAVLLTMPKHGSLPSDRLTG